MYCANFGLEKYRNLLVVKEFEMMSIGLRSLLMVEGKCFGLVATGLDDGGTVRGAHSVEGICIL